MNHFIALYYYCYSDSLECRQLITDLIVKYESVVVERPDIVLDCAAHCAKPSQELFNRVSAAIEVFEDALEDPEIRDSYGRLAASLYETVKGYKPPPKVDCTELLGLIVECIKDRWLGSKNENAKPTSPGRKAALFKDILPKVNKDRKPEKESHSELPMNLLYGDDKIRSRGSKTKAGAWSDIQVAADVQSATISEIKPVDLTDVNKLG